MLFRHKLKPYIWEIKELTVVPPHPPTKTNKRTPQFWFIVFFLIFYICYCHTELVGFRHIYDFVNLK